MKKKYTVKAWDGIMEWNSDYFSFEAENEEEAIKIAQDWFNNSYLPDILDDPQSYSWYPDEEDYETEKDYEDAIADAVEELRLELQWDFIEDN